jgi:glyoxylase-like metal-dependent hydrolase (beta-lactamase superfamily II)
LLSTPAHADDLSLKEVSPGVWAALQSAQVRFRDSNSVVIISNHDVVVVDSQSDPATVRGLIAAIRERTNKPVRYLVNTHFHSDHTRGNFIYRDAFPGIEIIGHPTLIEDIPKRSAPDLESELELYRREIPAGEARLARGINRDGEGLDEEGKISLAGQIESAKRILADLESIEWVAPTLTVPKSLTLRRNVGPIEIRAVYAHTRGDLVILLPEAGILITGDVLDDLPFAGHGYPSDWVEVLTELDTWEWDTMIPGHGRIRKGKEARAHLATVRSLFELMIEAGRDAATTGSDLENAKAAFLETQDLAILRAELAGDDPAAGRNFDRFVPAGFERAVLETQGELPD